ncbi:MAG: hypothetical protein V1743_03965 [Nanoarchaeota archaeon]
MALINNADISALPLGEDDDPKEDVLSECAAAAEKGTADIKPKRNHDRGWYYRHHPERDYIMSITHTPLGYLDRECHTSLLPHSGLDPYFDEMIKRSRAEYLKSQEQQADSANSEGKKQ